MRVISIYRQPLQPVWPRSRDFFRAISYNQYIHLLLFSDVWPVNITRFIVRMGDWNIDLFVAWEDRSINRMQFIKLKRCHDAPGELTHESNICQEN